MTLLAAAALALCGVVPIAWQTAPAATTATTVPPADVESADQPRPPAAPAPVTTAPAATAKRWIDWQAGHVESRYRWIENSAGTVTNDHLQHKQGVRAGFKFDEQGRYSVQAFAGTGGTFVSSWDNVGPGTGDKTWNFNVRQLYLQAQPVKGLEGQWGGLGIARGEHTEITTFDNDNFIVGGRLSVKRPAQLHLDELSVTVGYLGDLSAPNVLRRFDRWDEHNYTQVLAARKFGTHVAVSADWTDLDHVSTLRQAVRVATKAWWPLDAVRFENLQRVEGRRGYGFALTAEKAVHPRVLVTGGLMDLDEDNGTLSGDRYFRGKRVFVEPRFTIRPDLTVSLFYGEAFANDFPVTNNHRFDVVVSYNVLKAAQRAGTW